MQFSTCEKCSICNKPLAETGQLTGVLRGLNVGQGSQGLLFEVFSLISMVSKDGQSARLLTSTENVQRISYSHIY